MKDSVAEHSSGKISVLHGEVPTNPPGNASTSLGTNWEWALFFLLHFLKYQYNTLLAWISGAPQDSKASPFLHVEGPFLQLGPEGWLNCTRAYGSVITCVSLLSSRCAAWQVQNGLALYVTWTSIATLLNFTVVLIYKWNVPDEKATTASLSILALGLVIW